MHHVRCSKVLTTRYYRGIEYCVEDVQFCPFAIAGIVALTMPLHSAESCQVALQQKNFRAGRGGFSIGREVQDGRTGCAMLMQMEWRTFTRSMNGTIR